MGGGNSVSARIEPATTDRPAAGVFTTMPQHPVEGRKPGTLRPQKPLRLIRDGDFFYFILYLTLTRYTVTTRMTLH